VIALVAYGWLLVGQQFTTRLRRLLLVIGVCMIGAYAARKQLEPIIHTRNDSLTLQQHYDAGRTPLYHEAWRLFQQHPIVGTGLHGFEANYGYLVGFTYPHNLVLQVAAESGLLGSCALALVLLRTARTIRPRPSQGRLEAACAACGLLVFAASQFSGDYYDSRFCWIYLTLAVFLAHGPKSRRAATPANDATPWAGARLRVDSPQSVGS
jgi:O-antigen ligase